MTGRTSLLEQKRLQWAREREEMARLSVNWGSLKPNSNYDRTHIRTYSNDARLGEIKDRPSAQPFRAAGHYGSTVSLKSLTTESSGSGGSNLKCFDYNGGSLMNLRDQVDTAQMRRRSPSLPPIFSKDQQQYFQLEQQRDFGVEGSPYQPQRSQKLEHHRRRSNDHRENQKQHHHYGSPGEEREGETSGYASDSVDAPQAGQSLIDGKVARIEMAEKTWQNPYCTTPESSLPPSRRLSPGRMGELNRPRWGSVWGQDARGDPPPPSWLSRLGQSSQVLVINHDSASSPDSSTTGSTGSDTNKISYLRGQNIPVDADILQEREARRQKALELQNAIKQQLEEKDRQRKEEKEQRMREERLEDERIRREQEKERERFKEEQRALQEKEAAKMKKAQAMREVLEAAERLAMEERKNRRKREERTNEDTDVVTQSSNESSKASSNSKQEQNCSQEQGTSPTVDYPKDKLPGSKNPMNTKETDDRQENQNNEKKEGYSWSNHVDKLEGAPLDLNLKPLQVPVSKDVAIVLSGRLEDSEILSKANLQLVNLVVTPSPCRFAGNAADYLSLGLNAIGRNGSARNPRRSSRDASSCVVQNRLLTPSKYRTSAGRDFGTQTDVESDFQDRDHQSIREQEITKDRKETTNANRRNIEKSTNVSPGEEISMKTLPRSKSQPRTTLDSRPRWNANRPGTRYRTQSEKDPHYQRRLRLRRRQVESSDEGSRSPSPDRRKSNNGKSKNRNTNRRKAKLENYDADLSMDSLNSIVPLRIDKNGKINIEERAEKVLLKNACNDTIHAERLDNDNSNVWCGQEILSKLSSLRSGLLMKQIEWDSERCLVSPAASEIF
ncbi:histone-lysine N-methyltransferase, H3 lysine-79 specific isoform X2 [Ooceraea biroi]|uniref:histone-lysine N-methyltransferase, H3 lysine-79 specific isoform X2 n=1 Tax=Ooceraea biroi TaxID=2015173 RepID=UPI0005BE20BB|nr:histone-lysine N-methyltransferase, H3 lysine-79 specific isoform X2 [Ooceraea biroi]